ncbi:MAG: TIGR02270 family protein [Pedobacter sp.]
MSTPLDVIGWGAVTPVGLDARQTCAAARARISGVRVILTLPPDFEPVYGATVPAKQSLKQSPDAWLTSLACRAIREALDNLSPDPAHTALLLSVPAIQEPDSEEPRLAGKQWIKSIETRLKCNFHSSSAVFNQGHAAPVAALLIARDLLERQTVQYCLIAGVESMVNRACIDRLAEWNRLYGPENSQGVIPGEGSACLLVTLASRTQSPSLARIVGLGVDNETDTVLGTRTSVGKGLIEALKKALDDSGIDESAVTVRASDMNGERYRGLETLFADARLYRKRRQRHIMLLPAMSVADMGAAVAPLMIIMAATAMTKGYLPGPLTMCELSSEQGLRGACLVTGSSRLPQYYETAIAYQFGRERLPAVFDRPVSAKSVIPDVIGQHAEEGAFLWTLRRSAACRPNFSLSDFSDLDMRVDAHLDGLYLSGETGWEVCLKGLKWKAPGEFFAAAAVAFAQRDNKKIELVLAAVAKAPVGASGITSALGWLPQSLAQPLIDKLTSSKEALYRYIGISAAAVQQYNPGSVLIAAMEEADLRIRARALRAVGELGIIDLLPALRYNLNSTDPACRYWAAWSYVLRADAPAPALEVLREIAESDSIFRDGAATMAVRRMNVVSSQTWYSKFLSNLPQLRMAMITAGVSGDPDAVPWLIDLMRQKDLSRVAGEAFTTITGADLEQLKLEVRPSKDLETGPTDNPADDNVEMDPDDNLPWPDRDLIKAWWEKNKGSFKAGTRYLCGQPITESNLQHLLRYGYQRQRHAAALELAIRNPGQPLFNVRAPGFRQKQLLGLK